MKISPLYEASNDHFKPYCPGQEELLNKTGDIQVNNPRVTLDLSHIGAFPLSTMTDQLTPMKLGIQTI